MENYIISVNGTENVSEMCADSAKNLVLSLSEDNENLLFKVYKSTAGLFVHRHPHGEPKFLDRGVYIVLLLYTLLAHEPGSP